MKRFLAEFVESLRIAREQLGAHRTRAALTALGVIIGILAVTLMGTAIRGIDQGFQDSLSMIGTDVFYVERFPWKDVGDDWWRYRGRPEFEESDAVLFNRILTERQDPSSQVLLAVHTSQTWRPFSFGNRRIDGVEIRGSSPEFASVMPTELEHGRFFSAAEAQSGANVAVLGYDVAEALFPGLDPIGQKVVVGDQIKVEVIGVFARQGQFLGLFSFDKQAIMPLRTLRKFSRWKRHDALQVKMVTGGDKDLARQEIIGLMRQVRGLMPEEQDNFEVNRTELLEEQIGPMKKGIALAGFFITGLALFVGAIGIMNITFVSVKERTREIGTRRALGAPRRAILMQFLMESTSICLIGGFVGLSMAWAIQAALKAKLEELPLIFSADLFILALLVSVATGILSGFAPAWTASKLDPAEALRHD